MSNLKSKLAQKIQVSESVVKESKSENTMTYRSGNTKEDNKLIVLKSNEVNMETSFVPDFAISLNEAKERINMLQEFVKQMMIPKIDYGFIPNCEKPSLFKPGAEKLCDIFGFSKQIEILNRVEDWDKALFHYEVKVILINKRSGLIEAEGIGSCNSRERKLKKQDSYSIINTILKMAKKRALIDAVLSATRSSGIFTQDIEELDSEEKNSLSANIVDTKSKGANSQTKIPITKEQQTQIVLLINKNKIPIDYAKELMSEKYKIDQSKLLTSEQADEFIDLLKCSTVI